MGQNGVEEKEYIVEKSVFRSNKEEKKGKRTQSGYYSFIYGCILDSN